MPNSPNIVMRILLISLAICLVTQAIPGVALAESDDTAAATGERPLVIHVTLENGDKISVYDKAFLIEKPNLPNFPPLLHVQGTPYEMGYQHGILLADRITDLISGMGSPMMFMMGGWDPASGEKPTQEQLEAGKSLCRLAIQKCFLEPIKSKVPDYYREMQGLADGLQAAGSPAGLDEVLAAVAMAELSQSQQLLRKLASESASMNGSPDTVPGDCSDFAAWGAATKDGKLIHGTNYDNEDFTIGRHGVVMIARPQKGNAFLGMIHPGSPWPMRGMSTAEITVGEPTSNSSDNDILAHPQVGHCCHMRRVLQYANSAADAIAIMRELGGSTGWNIFTTDGKVPTAVDIQVSCTRMGVVHPMKGVDALWSTNQFTAYPGFQGYPENGSNLVKDQMEYWGVPWEKVDTIEKWQAWMRENRTGEQNNTWARYERFRELLKENRGQITPEKVIAFMSDPAISDVGPRITLSGPVKQLFGVERPIISQGMASVFSAVFVPADGIAYVAMGAEPAQAGKYWPISLPEQLRLMQTVSNLNVTDRNEDAIRKMFQEGIR